MSDQDRLKNEGWIHLDNDQWIRKNSFIDMSDGSNSCSIEDALKIQDCIDEWREEKNEG